MYSRHIKQGTFTIESAKTLFKEEYAQFLFMADEIKAKDNYGTIILRYSYATHSYYVITVYRSRNLNLNEIDKVKDKDTRDQPDSAYIGCWTIDRDSLKIFLKQTQLARNVALAIQNVQISKNDTQINVLTKAQNDAIFSELIEQTFEEIFEPQGRTPLEYKNSAMIELNCSPTVKHIIQSLSKSEINVPLCREMLAKLELQQEQLAYMYQIIDDNIDSIHGTVNTTYNSPSQE